MRMVPPRSAINNRELSPGACVTKIGELRPVARPRLFENYHGLRRPQRRLFALDSLGEGGWLKALQQALFAYAETPYSNDHNY